MMNAFDIIVVIVQLIEDLQEMIHLSLLMDSV